MLPRAQDDVVSLADVLPSCLSALGFTSESVQIQLPPSEAIVLVLVDGLGATNIAQARAYMRFIATAHADGRNIKTVFPSTTASALSTLATGVHPATHGILGYRIWDSQRGEHVNQLNGITERAVAQGWLASESLFSQLSSQGKPVTVVGHARFAHSELTTMLYGGVPYVGASSIDERFDVVTKSLLAGGRGLFFIYISDLDEAAHHSGCYSDLWLSRAEALDARLKTFAHDVAHHATVVLTADHGVVDVALSGHVDFGLGPEMNSVESVGGEPRCLQLKLANPEAIDAVAAVWRERFGEVADIRTRDEVDDLFYGGALEGSPLSVRERAGDIYVIAKDGFVFYDGREPNSANRTMVGQHGGPSDQEMEIPLIVWGQSSTLDEVVV